MKFGKILMKTLFVVVLFIASAVFITGCNRVVTNEKGVLILESKPVAGGLLRLASVETKTLNPLMVNSKSYKDIVPLLFTGLFEMENNGTTVASLADEATYKATKFGCRVKLKKGLKWSNGSSIKPEDVKYSFDLLKNQPKSMYYSLVKDISSCSIKNGAVSFQFEKNAPLKKGNLTFPIVKKGTTSEKKTIATNGRYKVSSHVNLDGMQFVANEKWGLGAKAFIPKVEVIFINDINVFVTAFQSQEVDVVNINNYDWSKYEEIRGTEALSYFTGEMEGVFFNCDSSILKDKRLRQAVAYGIDRQKLMNKYILGNGLVTDVPIVPDSWLNEDKNVRYSLSYNDSKRLVEEIKPTTKLTLNLLINTKNEKRLSMAKDIKASLKEANIEVVIESVSFAEYKSRILSKKFEMYLGAAVLPEVQDFSVFLNNKLPFYIKPLPKDGAYSLAKIANGVEGEEKLLEAAKAFQSAFKEELPYLPLYHKKGALILAGSIKGSADVARYNVFKSEGSWYFERKK